MGTKVKIVSHIIVAIWENIGFLGHFWFKTLYIIGQKKMLDIIVAIWDNNDHLGGGLCYKRNLRNFDFWFFYSKLRLQWNIFKGLQV